MMGTISPIRPMQDGGLEVSEGNPVIQRLLDADVLRRPVLRAAIRAARLPRGSDGIDVGCGIGLQALLLADAVGPGGHVTGLDIDPELLAHGEALVGRAGLAERVAFRVGDMRDLPLADHSADWAWSADCVGYPAGALAPVLDELVRVVRPGGSVVIAGWSSQQVLPGYPLLEARLNATCSAYEPFLRGQRPDAQFLRAAGGLADAGITDVVGRTFVRDVAAPLGSRERTALTSLLEMLWGTRTPQVAPEDWRDYRRLSTPGSPDFILHVPGYHAFFTYTMFRGRVPAA